jgi:5-methylcytosine-specific restriction protein A
MPWKLSGPCAQPGCPELAIRAGRCAAHQSQAPQRQYDAQRASPSKRGYGREWQKIRASHLVRFPFCCVCGAPATDVDHIIALVDGGTHDYGNLQSLCHAHHSAKTARENGGWGRAG